MSATPFFSVGVPTYNRAKIFPAAVRAVLGQTFSDFELLVADNHSTDETAAVVSRFQDARLKYFRHERNLGPLGNFNFLARQARGEFLVICQDDDLLHRDFLKRCHESVAQRPDVVLYATPWWRGNSVQGCRSHLMRDGEGQNEDYIINDRPLLLDGKRAAVLMMYAFPIAHPAIAFRDPLFQELGCYSAADDYYFDIMAEVRLLCRGNMIYDPRLGAVFHEHPGNFSLTFNEQKRLVSSQKMYQQAIAELEAHQVDWAGIMSRDLEGYSFDEMLRFFSDWTRYAAPLPMQELGWEKLWKKNPRTRLWFWKKVFSRIGVRNLARFARARLRVRRAPASTRPPASK